MNPNQNCNNVDVVLVFVVNVIRMVVAMMVKLEAVCFKDVQKFKEINNAINDMIPNKIDDAHSNRCYGTNVTLATSPRQVKTNDETM